MTQSNVHRYRSKPAGWLGLATNNLVVAADLAENDPRVTVLERLMATGEPAARLIEALAATEGTVAASCVVVDLVTGDVVTAFIARRGDQVVPIPDLGATIPVTTLSELDLIGDVGPAEDAEEITQDSSSIGYRHLFGETFMRSVEDAAVRDDPSPGDAIEDRTTVGVNVDAVRGARRASRKRAMVSPPAPIRFVELPSGSQEPLDRPIIFGRSPSAERAPADNIPRLIALTTPDQQLSRNHAQVAVEGETVVVTDLHSRNGTLVVLPGKPPQQLRAGHPTPVVVGTIIDLGDGAMLVIRDSS